MSEIRVDTISEKTSANGVAVDGVTIKDGGITVTGAAILNGGIDIVGNLTIDVDGSTITLADGGVNFGQFYNNASGTFNIVSPTQDKDIVFRGDDGGTGIVALTIDMSDGGRANFGNDIGLNDDRGIRFGAGDDLTIFHDGNSSFIRDSGTGGLIIQSDSFQVKNASGNESVLVGAENGAVTLYHDNAVKLTTTTTGATITGGIVTSGDSRINATNNNNQALQIESNDDNKEAVRIVHSDADNPQGLVIAYTGGAPDSAGGDKFIRCSDTGAERFHVDAAGDILADGVATNSDERLKENIADATDKWDDIKALKVRNFTWKAEHHPKRNHKHIGFIAQEFETVFPALVKEHNIHPDPVYVEADKDADGNLPEGKEIGDVKNTKNRKNIHTTAMIPMLTKALQEAMAKIETLETKVATLEG